MKGKKPVHFYSEVWKMNFWYFIGWKQKEYEEYLFQEFSYEAELSNSDGNCVCAESDTFLVQCIWIRFKTDYPALAHECVHAANNTLRIRGHTPCYDNDEPQTYLVEAIFRKAILPKGVK